MAEPMDLSDVMLNANADEIAETLTLDGEPQRKGLRDDLAEALKRVRDAAVQQEREGAAQCAFEFFATVSHELSEGDAEMEDAGRRAAGACARAIRERRLPWT